MSNEYRIRNHPLEEVGDYTMTLYIDMLCTIASYENAKPEAAYKLIANIMLSAGMKHPISEHIKNAMQLTPERFSEFVTECRNNELQYIFLIDSLLIICSNGQPCKKQIEFIAGIATIFEINRKNFKYLSEITAKILEQDRIFFSNDWSGWSQFISSDEIDFLDYLCELSDNENSNMWESYAKTVYNSICYIKQLSDIHIKLTKYPRYSKDTKQNQLFYGEYSYSQTVYYESYHETHSFIKINDSYNKVVIENVFLNNRNARLGFSNKTKEVILRNCTLGGIHWGGSRTYPAKITLENCTFDNMYSYFPESWGEYKIYGNHIYAVNCIFNGYHVEDNSKYDKEHLFGGSTECVNCTFTKITLKENEHSPSHYTSLINCEIVDSYVYDIPNNIKEFKNVIFRNCYLGNIPQNTIDTLKQNGCQFIGHMERGKLW